MKLFVWKCRCCGSYDLFHSKMFSRSYCNDCESVNEKISLIEFIKTQLW